MGLGENFYVSGNGVLVAAVVSVASVGARVASVGATVASVVAVVAVAEAVPSVAAAKAVAGIRKRDEAISCDLFLLPGDSEVNKLFLSFRLSLHVGNKFSIKCQMP